MPQRITDTLLVVTPFKDRNGTEYLAGDRAPIRHRWIRRLAAEQPELFVMEHETEPVDLEWLAGLEVDAEGRYEAVKRLRDAEKDRRHRALREELEAQDRGQPGLQRRFKEQEKERERREQEALEEREREEVEREVASAGGLQSGFHF
jgi:hypothetical protein